MADKNSNAGSSQAVSAGQKASTTSQTLLDERLKANTSKLE
jgi:hypothetical protein